MTRGQISTYINGTLFGAPGVLLPKIPPHKKKMSKTQVKLFSVNIKLPLGGSVLGSVFYIWGFFFRTEILGTFCNMTNIFICRCPNRSGVGAIDDPDRSEQVPDQCYIPDVSEKFFHARHFDDPSSKNVDF